VKSLGKIKISIMCDNYNIQFKYATPKKIDFFTLTLLEIIKHSKNFKGKTIYDILLMLEIPQDLHYIFQDRLKELMQEPVMVNQNGEGVLWVHNLHSNVMYENRLLNNVEKFSLAPLGEEAYQLKEIIGEPLSFLREYIFETANNSFIQREKANISDFQDAITVEMDTPSENEVKNIFTREINENPKKYIKNANPRTKIYYLMAKPIGRVGIRNTILVSINDGKLQFDNENKKILNEFLSINAEKKKSIKKMFNYLNIPQTKVNFDKASLTINRSQYKIKMKIAFGKKAAINEVTDADHRFEVDRIAFNNVSDFCFAGITDGDRPLIYNYCEITDQGYTLPLEELDYSEQNYNAVFSSVFETCKANIAKGGNLKEFIGFAVLASPPEKRMSVVKSIMEQTKDLKNALETAKIILNTAANKKQINDAVKDFILDLIKENLSKGKTDVDTVIGIMKEIDLPKERVIRILAEGAPMTDKTINALLTVNEEAVVRIYELVKLYNSLLKAGKLPEINHNTNLYSAFSDYDRQYKKLKIFGFKNYYEYDMPKNWDEFMKEVYILQSMFNKIKNKLDNDIVKQASDFFIKVNDDYDELATIDEKVVKKLLDSGDLQSLINSAKTDEAQIALAGIIRNKYDEALRTREKAKDPGAAGGRKGRALFEYTVEPKNVNEVDKHWRNLCILVHKATALNDPLWKGGGEDRKKALNGALNYFNQKLASKEEKNESSKQSAV